MNEAQAKFQASFQMPSNPRSLARDWQEAEEIGVRYGVKPHPLGKEQSYNCYKWVDWKRLKSDVLDKLAADES